MSDDFITDDTFIADYREEGGVTEVLLYKKTEDKWGRTHYYPWCDPLPLVQALDLARCVSHLLGGLPTR